MSSLVVKDKQLQQSCSIVAELELVHALRRRSLAFDLVELVDYDKFNAYSAELVEHLSLAPPLNYSPVSVQQGRSTGVSLHGRKADRAEARCSQSVALREDA